MPAGQPQKFKSPKESFKVVDDLEGISDGDVQTKSDYKIYSDDFSKEKNLLDYIIPNIQSFCQDICKDELVSFEIEKPVNPQIRLSPRGRRMDLFVIGKKKNYVIELKNPKHFAENRYAIGQLLDYGREYLDPKKELILITTKFDINTAKTIKFYNLPIRYIYLDKKRMLEFKGEKW